LALDRQTILLVTEQVTHSLRRQHLAEGVLAVDHDEEGFTTLQIHLRQLSILLI